MNRLIIMENSSGFSKLNLRLPSPDQLRNSGLLSSSRDIEDPLNQTGTSVISKESQQNEKTGLKSLIARRSNKKKVLSARNSPNGSHKPTANLRYSPRGGVKSKTSLTKIKALLEKCNSNLLKNLQQLSDIDMKLRKLEVQESYQNK